MRIYTSWESASSKELNAHLFNTNLIDVISSFLRIFFDESLNVYPDALFIYLISDISDLQTTHTFHTQVNMHIHTCNYKCGKVLVAARTVKMRGWQLL